MVCLLKMVIFQFPCLCPTSCLPYLFGAFQAAISSNVRHAVMLPVRQLIINGVKPSPRTVHTPQGDCMGLALEGISQMIQDLGKTHDQLECWVLWNHFCQILKDELFYVILVGGFKPTKAYLFLEQSSWTCLKHVECLVPELQVLSLTVRKHTFFPTQQNAHPNYLRMYSEFSVPARNWHACLPELCCPRVAAQYPLWTRKLPKDAAELSLKALFSLRCLLWSCWTVLSWKFHSCFTWPSIDRATWSQKEVLVCLPEVPQDQLPNHFKSLDCAHVDCSLFYIPVYIYISFDAPQLPSISEPSPPNCGVCDIPPGLRLHRFADAKQPLHCFFVAARCCIV